MSKNTAPNPARFSTGEAFESAYIAWSMRNGEEDESMAQEDAIQAWYDHCEQREIDDELGYD